MPASLEHSRWKDAGRLAGSLVRPTGEILRLVKPENLPRLCSSCDFLGGMGAPGRGPGFQRRDPWRSFKFEARRVVLTLAGSRCEGPLFFAWGRCGKSVEEVDHVYPWSKCGATIINNGQALCRSHNRSKSNLTPPWWYVVSLERRRWRYYPAGAAVRISAAMSTPDKAARADWTARRRLVSPDVPRVRRRRRARR